MSEKYDNTNKGAIWPNKNRKEETHPHFNGSLNVEGVEYWVDAWKRPENAREGSPSLRFRVKKKEAKPEKKKEVAPADPNDDIPF